jgi:hypothetical protein
MRTWVAVALFVVALVGCGENNQRSSAGSERIERCADRFLERAKSEDANTEETRRYIEVTYCTPFAERGWVYEDGTLNIAAQTWLIEGSSEECVSAGADEPAQTVPCEELEPQGGMQVIDCAILHQVRTSEVRKYLEQLQRKHEVECDDGTPLEGLGASG